MSGFDELARRLLAGPGVNERTMFGMQILEAGEAPELVRSSV